MLMIGDIQTLAADIAFALDVALVSLYLDDAVCFHLDFQAAVLCAKDASGFINGSHHGSFLRPYCRMSNVRFYERVDS